MATNNKPVMRRNTSGQPPASIPKAYIPALTSNNDHEMMAAALSAAHNPVEEKATGFRAAEISRSEGSYLEGQTYRRVPLSEFQKSENNARYWSHRPDELDEMTQSLRDDGQDTPVIGWVNTKGKIALTDGQKRFQASLNGGLQGLDVKIIAPPESEAQEYETSRRINLMRSAQSSLDDAFMWRDLIDRGVYKSQDELAQRLGEKIAKVSKVMGITRIPERLIRTMIENEKTRSWSIAYLVSTIFDPSRVNDEGLEKVEAIAEEIVEEIIKKELPKNKVEALISRRLQGARKRVQAESTPLRFGEAKGEMKTFPGRGQFDVSFRGLTDDKLAELRELIQKALTGQLQLSS
jgi:ParB family chromosome partitioning protein